MWNEERMLRAVDRFERLPPTRDVSRSMKSVSITKEWGLVALGITTAIPDIVQDDFVGSHVIVLDGSSTRTHFLYIAA